MDDFNTLKPIKMMIVVTKMYHAINDQLERHLKAIHVNRSEFLVLHALASKGPATIQGIAEKVYISSSTMSYTVDKLVSRDLVKRRPSDKDRRMVYLEMTQAGQVLWDYTIKAHVEHLSDMFGSVDEASLDQVIELMKVIGKAAKIYGDEIK